MEIKDFTLSLQPQNDGAIAQLVEQRTENPCVPGSIPGGTTKNPDSQESQDFLFSPDTQKNGKILPFEVKQKVEIEEEVKISTKLKYFSLIYNISRIKKTWPIK